jgi:hypothetical protein
MGTRGRRQVDRPCWLSQHDRPTSFQMRKTAANYKERVLRSRLLSAIRARGTGGSMPPPPIIPRKQRSCGRVVHSKNCRWRMCHITPAPVPAPDAATMRIAETDDPRTCVGISRPVSTRVSQPKASSNACQEDSQRVVQLRSSD